MSTLPQLKESTKWLVAALAPSVSILSNAVLLWLTGAEGIFKQSFGQLRFLYYSIVVVAISIAIYVISIRYPSQRLVWLASSAISAYLASTIAYFILAAPNVERRVAVGHWETLFVIFILPTHLFFIVAAVIAAIAMIGFLTALRIVSN